MFNNFHLISTYILFALKQIYRIKYRLVKGLKFNQRSKLKIILATAQNNQNYMVAMVLYFKGCFHSKAACHTYIHFGRTKNC